jgi:transposase
MAFMPKPCHISSCLASYIIYGKALNRVIGDEFNRHYHPGHVRKLLKQLGYSVQRPTTRLVQADPDRKNRWVRYTYPRLKKKPEAKGR